MAMGDSAKIPTRAVPERLVATQPLPPAGAPGSGRHRKELQLDTVTTPDIVHSRNEKRANPIHPYLPSGKKSAAFQKPEAG